MRDNSPVIPCPSCGAPLDSAGHCAYCGSQARGFWLDLDLGTPELAAAILEGLDYYLILGALPQADAAAVAEAYRLSRRRFPDDPRRLEPRAARQLGLIEEAWRILGVPMRREVYDRLRAEQAATARRNAGEVRTIRCPQCGAPVALTAPRCSSCGTPRTVESAPAVPRPVADFVDYYTILGVEPRFIARPPAKGRSFNEEPTIFDLGGMQDVDAELTVEYDVLQPGPDELKMAYLEQLERLAYRPDLKAEEDVEVAYRVLADPSRHGMFCTLLEQLKNPTDLKRTLQALTSLDREVRAEVRGTNLHEVDGAALLDQGRGYLQLRLYQQAVPVLAEARKALPESAEAHYLYGMALWESADAAALTPHVLRQMDAALTKACELDTRLAARVEPYLHATRGLLHYGDGELEPAAQHFQVITARYPDFLAAWRMLAAVFLQQGKLDAALSACRQALRVDPDNEAVLFLALAVCWRQQQPEHVREIAGRIARIRGHGVHAEDILREVGLQ